MEPCLEMKEWSCDSSLLQSLAQALALGARCTACAIQREEEETEKVVAARKGVGGCGEGGREGRRDIITARTWAECTRTDVIIHTRIYTHRVFVLQP